MIIKAPKLKQALIFHITSVNILKLKQNYFNKTKLHFISSIGIGFKFLYANCINYSGSKGYYESLGHRKGIV